MERKQIEGETIPAPHHFGGTTAVRVRPTDGLSPGSVASKAALIHALDPGANLA